MNNNSYFFSNVLPQPKFCLDFLTNLNSQGYIFFVLWIITALRCLESRVLKIVVSYFFFFLGGYFRTEGKYSPCYSILPRNESL